ncbi:aspartyl protease family protein [Vibrio mediterranei]|uniref:aspartyl protease family protein n=1 Tax=Vibrio mediterranei TaxID=689 RepID=UPI00148BECF3|nr:aspartyl protease family protein [Vibrio mediterranei]NOI26382.1 hypothetical protein [Vibrio mediterranei]
MRLSIILAVCLVSTNVKADDLYLGHPSPSHYSVTMPFRLTNDSIYVDVHVKDNLHHFLLDTGAATLISPSFINKYKLNVTTNNFEFTDSNGSQGKVPIYYLPDIAIGKTIFSGYTASAFNGLDEKPFSCLNVSGIIGYNMLRDSVVTFDFINRKIKISDTPPKGLEDEGYFPIGFYFDGYNGPILHLWHNFGSLDVVLDTGSNGGITLNYPGLDSVLNDLGYKGQEIKGGVTYFAAAGGKENENKSEIYKLTNFSLGRLNVKEFPVTVSNRAVESLVGVKFLKQYDIVLDFKASIAWLKPNGIITESLIRPSFGIYPTIKENKFVVDAILTGSKADLVGVLPNDHIIEADKRNTNQLTDSDFCRLFLKSEYRSYTIEGEKSTISLY